MRSPWNWPYQVDAFATRPFEGNPAAVCPLPEWLDDATLQAIVAEKNLSETAFFVREQSGYRLRWFAPRVETDLGGHAYTVLTEKGRQRYLEAKRDYEAILSVTCIFYGEKFAFSDRNEAEGVVRIRLD